MNVPAKLGYSLVFLFAVVVVLPTAIIFYAFVSVVTGFTGTYDETTKVECGVIFGAAVHSVSDPGPGILRRVEAGVRLYEKELLTRLIVTGGKGSETQESEAEVMQKVAIARGIPSDRIRMEPFSSSTWNNVRNSLPLLQKCTSIVAISDRYHLARIRLIGKRQGIELETFPADAPVGTKFEMMSVVRETIGYAYYLVKP